MKCIAVIPAYNEQKRIGEVVKKATKMVSEVVVVNDGSKDLTLDTLYQIKKENLHILNHLINRGKGCAVRTGCDYAFESLDATHVILLDGDGQHEPEEISRFAKTLEKTQAEIIFGKRRREKTMPFVSKVGNWFLSSATNLIFGMNIHDTQGGFRMLSYKAYNVCRWEANDYAMETEMIARAGKKHLKYAEVNISTIYHDALKGTSPIDGVKIFLRFIKWRLFL